MTDKAAIGRRIAELRGLIEKANRDYYDLAQPTVGDRDYDMWEQELLRLEKENPEFATDDLPVRNVAGGVSEGFA
ncbi:MAG: NAD-dependent DNA ligase LigA, partial [bacterium]|nr:NAD-dependent DNA ligase LigA [Candidatus Colisoma equi]